MPTNPETDPTTTDRATLLAWAADFAEEVAEKLRAHHEFERSNGALDVMTELRRMADEAQQPEPTTVDKAAALGMTDAEYRAHSHRAAVEAIRAAIPGLYATVGLRVEDALAEQAAVGVRQPDTETQRRQTVEYFVQSEQPDGTWESASSFSTDAAFAAARLSGRRQMMPDLTLRLAERTTTVTVQPLPDCLACRHWCCNGDGPCGALLSAWERCTCPGPAVSRRPAADDSGEETP